MKRVLVFGVGVVLATSCSTSRVEAPAAERVLAELRGRFPGVLDRAPASSATQIDVRVIHGEVAIEDRASGVGVRVRARRSLGGRVEVDGLSVFPDSKVVVRVGPRGVEDFVSFDTQPARDEEVYDVVPTGGASFRVVPGSDTVEVLDAEGTPRVRMTPPWLVDASKKRTQAKVAFEACAFDASPAPPWGRPTTPPGRDSCELRLTWRDVTYPALLDPEWTLTTSAFLDRDSHTAVKLANGKVLFTYGEVCAGGCFLASATSSLFDPATKTFAQTGNASAKGSSIPGVGLANGKALVMSNVGPLLYDPTTGLFASAGAQGTLRSAGSTLTVLANGKVLSASGTTADLYDPVSDTFTPTPPMKASHLNHAAALLANGKVLLSGGPDVSAELYDPVANDFTSTDNLKVARSGHQAVRLGSGKILIAGGGLTSAELYDPVTGLFSLTGSLTAARPTAEVVGAIGGGAYVIGGHIQNLGSAVVERYDPDTGMFLGAPFLKIPRAWLRVTLLDSGALLATGGRTLGDANGGSLSSAELFDVVSPGGACVYGDDCSTGVCDRGVCCATACDGVCRSCVTGTGACEVVANADDPSSCTGANTCDVAGTCKKKNGRACAANAECASAACVDGVCCDRACTGACEACDGPSAGTCALVAGRPHGARTCASDGTSCGGACDGTIADRCTFPGASTGCGTACANAARTASACDGKGACVAQEPKPCPGNFTCADEKTCRVSCSAPADCSLGYTCTEGKCTPTAYCDGDHAIVAADGKSTTDCAPFRCDPATSRCRTSCSDVNQCAEPFFCDSSGQCVTRPNAPTGCASSPRASSGAALSLVLLGLLASRRRRR